MLDRYLAEKYRPSQNEISEIEGPCERMNTLNAYESGASFMPISVMQTELDDPSTALRA